MNAPLFKQLSHDEFTRLSLEEQLDYMRQLMVELRQQSAETRRQLEEAQATLAMLEQKFDQ